MKTASVLIGSSAWLLLSLVSCIPSGAVGACGDGEIQDGESCDDGVDNGRTATCTPRCDYNVCGDGFRLEGVEACDDGNRDDADGCRNDCALPSCGDGVVQVDEECDDGNDRNEDACLNSCRFNTCGDGFVWPEANGGAEECDDGDGLNGDSAACLSSCRLNVCGDGFVLSVAVSGQVEACDDGGREDWDGCDQNCDVEPYRYTFSLSCDTGREDFFTAIDLGDASPDEFSEVAEIACEVCSGGSCELEDICTNPLDEVGDERLDTYVAATNGWLYFRKNYVGLCNNGMGSSTVLPGTIMVPVQEPYQGWVRGGFFFDILAD